MRLVYEPTFNLSVHRSVGIRMVLGLPDPDPLVRGTDPDPNLSIVKKNSKKNLHSSLLYDFLSLKND
jgi:hypothetical protein